MVGSRRHGRDRTWRLLLLHALLIQAVTALIRPTTSYRALELGVESQWLGVLSAAFAVVPLVVAVAVGRAADRRGERPVLLLGAALVAAAAAGFVLLSNAVALLAVWSVVLGLGHLLCMVGGQSMVAATAGADGLDRAFGVYTFAASAGQAVGPVVVAIVGGEETLPNTTPLFVAALVGALTLAAVAVPLSSAAAGPRSVGSERGGEVAAALRVPGMGRAVLASLTVLAAIDLLIAYLPALGAERGLSAQAVGVLLLIRAATSMASRFLLGALVGRLGRTRVLVGFTVAAGAAVALLAVDLAFPILVVLMAVAGFGLGVGQPLTLSWVARVAPERIRATAISLRLTGNRLGQTLLPAGLGMLAAGAGTPGVLLATGAALTTVGLVSGRGGTTGLGEGRNSRCR